MTSHSFACALLRSIWR